MTQIGSFQVIRIAIVEDNDSDLGIIQNFLKKYESENCIDIQITVYPDGEDILQIYKHAFDIILMDIQMAFIDGITAAEEIRKIDTEVEIIFVTNLPQYAIKGYKVNAINYMLKPLSYFELSQSINRAISHMKRKADSLMTIDISGGIIKIDESRIKFIEVQSHNSIFHTLDGIIQVRISLKDVETKLKSFSFFRCHKWYIVNMDFVDSLENFNIHIGDEIIQVSRPRRKDFFDALNNYFSEVIA